MCVQKRTDGSQEHTRTDAIQYIGAGSKRRNSVPAKNATVRLIDGFSQGETLRSRRHRELCERGQHSVILFLACVSRRGGTRWAGRLLHGRDTR